MMMQNDKKNIAEFERIYLSFYPRLKRFAQQYLIREEDVENIVHDIFSELWEKKMEFSSFVNFSVKLRLLRLCLLLLPFF